MVVITISSGKIRGKKNTLAEGTFYYCFQNIPYAQPPVGALRFRAPQPVQPWEGVKDCTKEGSESVSRHLITKQIVGSEDCLNLNVYTRELHYNTTTSNLKPVMFWIHGGTFMTGSNKTEFYGPEFLMAEDVVLVTINYRLGILGFLSLDDSSLGVPGNAGFKDMVLALKWVQDNISHFSGDPNNVTVFGQSAGAAAAHLLMLSPMTRGLLHRVIAQSASALNIWVVGRRSAGLIARKLGFSSRDDTQLLLFLQNQPAQEILKVQILIDGEDFVQRDFRFFGLVIERPSNEEAFMTENPIDIILSGNYNHVPLIMGYNDREGMAIDDVVPSKLRESYFDDLELSVPLSLRIIRGCKLSADIAREVEQFYFGKVKSRNRNDHLLQYYKLSTDTTFFREIYFSIHHHLKTSTKPIYLYKFCLETELNIFKRILQKEFPGVYHGDEIGYVFKTKFTPKILPNSKEDQAQKKVTKLWTNFARIGIPTPDPKDRFLNVDWKPVLANDIRYLEIGEQFKMSNGDEQERMKFWTKIFRVNLAASKL